jgi:hypothetical protein
LGAAHPSRGDLQEDPQFESRSVVVGYIKLESTLRSLGIEVDDAFSIADQVEL